MLRQVFLFAVVMTMALAPMASRARTALASASLTPATVIPPAA